MIGDWKSDASLIAKEPPMAPADAAGASGIPFPTSAAPDSPILSQTTEVDHTFVMTHARNDAVSTDVEVAPTETLVLVAMFFRKKVISPLFYD